jgi:hypothetical protein
VTYLSLGWPANKKFRRLIEGAMQIAAIPLQKSKRNF